MAFCALSIDQHKSLYKLIYKTILEDKTFDLQNFTKSLYDKVNNASKNHELALTYASYVPTYVSNLQTEDKQIRTILKEAKTDANELIDKIDEWENNLPAIENYIGVYKQSLPLPKAQQEFFEKLSNEEKEQIGQRVQNKADVKNVMETLFQLPEVQAEAVATIYDMVSKSYAQRTNSTPDDFYKTLTFTGQLPQGDPLYQIVGPKTISRGKGADTNRIIDNFNLAQRLDKQGKSQLEIFHQTGWEKVDGQWKTELPYGKIQDFDKKQVTYKLTELYKDSGIEKYYPYVKDMQVTFISNDVMEGLGEFDFSNPDKPFIYLNSELKDSKSKLKYVLVHELQHYVQFKEGNLTNRPNYQSTDEYVYDPSEIEANNAGFRATTKGNLNYESITTGYQKATELEDYILTQRNSNIARAAVQIGTDGQAIIYALTNPNVSSPLHELAHVWEHYLTPEEINTILEWTGQLDNNKYLDPNSDIDIITNFNNETEFWVKDKDNNKLHDAPFKTMKEAEDFLNIYNQEKGNKWTRDTSEQFARGFEAYLNEGKAYDFNLQVLFDRFREWLTDIYRAVFKFQLNKDGEIQDIRDLSPEQYQSRVNKANKLKEQGKSFSEIYDETGMVQNNQGAWLPQAVDVSGSEIDLQLNDAMRKIYSAMLGTEFNAKLLEEENSDAVLRAEYNRKAAQQKENFETSKDYTKPIPGDSPFFYGHLSAIQQAFLNKTYDRLVSEGKLTEDKLRTIVNSTKFVSEDPEKSEAGLSPELVDQVMFRVNHPELMEDVEYWRSMPPKNSDEYKTYRLAIREIAFNGNLENSINNDIITPQQAREIIAYTGQIAVGAERAIKAKEAEIEERGEQAEVIIEKAEIESPKEPIKVSNKQIVMRDVRDTAKDLYNNKGHKSIYLQMLKDAEDEKTFDEVMKGIAEQASDPRTYDPSIQEFGLYIVDKALEMYPDIYIEPLQITETITQEEPEVDNNEIQTGDTVDFKGDRFEVSEIIYGETPSDNMYLLSNGQMKFAEQLRKVPEQELYDNLLNTYNTTAPSVLEKMPLEDEIETDKKGNQKIIKGELTDEDQEGLNYAGLKTLLERLRNKFGINYHITKSNEKFIGRIKDGIVEINLAKYDRTTPFHEYLHPFIEVLKLDNRQLYINLARELGTLKEGQDLIKEVSQLSAYKDLTSEEIGDEALVRYISKKAAQNVNFEGRRKKSTFKDKMNNLIEKFKAWFEKLWNRQLGGMIVTDKLVKGIKKGERDFASIPLTATLEDIADMVSIHDVKFDLSTRMDFIKTLEKYQDETESEELSYEEKMIQRIKKKVSVLENTARQRLNNDVLLKEVVMLRNIFKEEPDPVLSLIQYMQSGLRSLDFASMEFSAISNKLRAAEGNLTEQELQQMASDLKVVQNLIVFYKDAEEYFLHIAKYNPKEFTDEEYRFFRETLDNKERILGRMKSVSADLTTEWLYPKIDKVNEKIKDKSKILTKEKFRNAIYSADNDIDLAFYNLGAISSSRDPVSAIIRSAIYEVVESNHEYETQTLEDIKINYDKFLNDTGISNSKTDTEQYYKDNYLRKATIRIQDGFDENKNPKFKYVEHWAFIEEFDNDLFDKDRTSFLEFGFGQGGFQPTLENGNPNQSHIDKLLAWENANGQRVQIGTQKQKQNIYESDDRNAKKIGEEWVDVPVTKLVGGEKYRNADYQARNLANDTFYQTLIKHYTESNDRLGDNRLLYGIIPQVSKGKNMFVDYKDKTPIQKLKTLGDKTYSFFVAPRVEEETTTDSNPENLDGSKFRNIQTLHTTLLEESDLDFTLPETIARFASSSNLTALKREINPQIDIVKSLIEGNDELRIKARKVTKVTSDNKTIFDYFFKRPASVEKERVKLNKQLTEFINDVMYGDSSQEATVEIMGRSVDLNKLGSNWSFLTALNNMAFNLTGAINNAVIGNTQAFIESTGGRYFTKSNFAKGERQYFSNTKAFVEDSFNLKKSKITQLGIKYDAIQGEFRDKYGKKFVGNLADRYANTDTIFFMNHIAEHQIQLSGMLALMDATKVITNDGQEITLFDAHVINKDGFLRLRDDIKWTKQDDLDFTNRWHAINKRLNGNYSTFDKSILQRRWYGKIALIYRKYIYTSFRNRFTKDYTDYELGNTDFGYQRKFFSKLASDIKEYKFEAAQRFFSRKGWTEDEKYAYNKTMTEFGFLAGAALLAWAVAASEADDDDTSWAKASLLLYLVRFRNDMAFFTIFGVPDVVRILQNPSAIMVTMGKYADFFAQLGNPTDTYSRKTGPFEKGELKLKAKFLKAFPIVRQVINTLSPKEQLAYYNVLKN